MLEGVIVIVVNEGEAAVVAERRVHRDQRDLEDVDLAVVRDVERTERVARAAAKALAVGEARTGDLQSDSERQRPRNEWLGSLFTR